jgi:hypothetical protein
MPQGDSYHPDLLIDLLREAIGTLASAADPGPQALFSEARILFRNVLRQGMFGFVRSAGAWREWENCEGSRRLIEASPLPRQA